ncbi:MAG: aminopeptidase P N-terminal domain-containing protein [Deltaproteobacteria bacterium]|nr:aminopeptidase P N-terminal domain-containing protein [Deltaproteobacteria bacterium]
MKKPLHPIDFAHRRKTFLSKIKNAVAVFPSAPEVIRNNDVHHEYRQDTNFYYLSSFEEPNSVLLFDSNSTTPFQMFVQPKDKLKELWEGKIFGPEGVKKDFGANAAFSSIDPMFFDEAFVKALLEADAVYYRVGINADWDRRIFMLMKKALRHLGRTGRGFWPIHDPLEVLGEMRLIKTKAEAERLEHAANITAEAHVNAMRIAKPGMYEYEVEAALYHGFRGQGASRLGYGSIVAAGSNACVLHYVANNKQLQDKELLLIDAGAEYQYYTADITRCFPVSGQFTVEQKDIYSAVLKAQKSCVKMATPGKSMKDLHHHAIEILVEELKRLKVLKGATASLIKNKAFFPYYPHGTGHWLGMDVHDAGHYFSESYETPRKLEAGMVITIEPGLYFGAGAKGPSKYHGIGIRIEDDVLITTSGCKVLTTGAPKEIEEIESLCT